jgi:hypothetical protein
MYTYNIGESKQPMGLVMFSDALEHVAKIARILRQPQGNALLLGMVIYSYIYMYIYMCMAVCIFIYLSM